MNRFLAAFVALVAALGLGAIFAPAATAGGGSDACAPYANVSWPLDTVVKSGKSYSLLSGLAGVALTSGRSTLTVTVTATGDYAPKLTAVLGGTKVYRGTSTEVTFPKTALNNKLKVAYICADITEPPPPPQPSSTGTLAFSCHPATYVGRNWEFEWAYTGGTVDHTLDISYSDVETGLTETLSSPIYAGSLSDGSTFEQANIGDHVTISVAVDGVDQPDFAYSGVVDSTMTCAASMTLP